MSEKNSRSIVLLNKVYNHLDSINVSELSLRELQDFLEVVQKGQFLENFGKIPPFGFGGWGGIHNAGSGGTINCETIVEQESAEGATTEA